MTIIQLLLLLGFAFSLLLYLKFFRSVLRDRLIVLVLFVTAVTAILFPDLTTKAANFLGVGRGTDLLIYIFATASVFAFILISTRLLNMEKNMTELVRFIAIKNAEKPGNSK